MVVIYFAILKERADLLVRITVTVIFSELHDQEHNMNSSGRRCLIFSRLFKTAIATDSCAPFRKCRTTVIKID